ncbi:hypothetical protein E2562_034823 [Oryza meyeriana var. granulata]|uniref:Uncharacterized protein n=1 Tax=Oryza meyeriana var. granulata TaxID=110450 RepID=A0A6G1E6E9_9ORYZ|nr:hypothetical protein E2562_034823 [Oryza meyeriana var. granulata]
MVGPGCQSGLAHQLPLRLALSPTLPAVDGEWAAAHRDDKGFAFLDARCSGGGAAPVGGDTRWCTLAMAAVDDGGCDPSHAAAMAYSGKAG